MLTRLTRKLWLAALPLAVLGEKKGSENNREHSLKQEELLAPCRHAAARGSQTTQTQTTVSTKNTSTNIVKKKKKTQSSAGDTE